MTVTRLSYNYFVQDRGMDPGPYDFRVTDVTGQQIESDAVALGDDVDRPATMQFAQSSKTSSDGIGCPSHVLIGSGT